MPGKNTSVSNRRLRIWQTIPRFEREYALADLAVAVRALAGGAESSSVAFSRLFPARPFHFVRTGRESLYLILKILGLRPGSRIGVPLYCCMAVFQAIAASGHVPVFLDVDLNDYAIDRDFLLKHRNKIDALVVVHTFGYPADISQIRECLAGRNLPVVEDCAHSLFSEHKTGLTGTLTDASFFSFAPHKPAPVGGGGLLVINNPELVPAAQCEMEKTANAQISEEIRHSLTCLTRSLAYHRLPYGALMTSPFRRLRDQDGGNPTEKDLARIRCSWSPAEIRRVDLPLVVPRIREFRAKMPALANNARHLREHIQGVALVTPPEPSGGNWNHFLFPVRYASPESRESGRGFLLSRGIDTSPLFENCVRNARWFGYEGGCPQAEWIAQTVSTVPHYASLSDEEILHVGRSLRRSAEGPGMEETGELLAAEQGR
jgi:perosamine synthetase